jgi:hypothetical protein
MDRGGGTSQIIDFIDLDIERERHVMSHRLEERIREEMSYIGLPSREVVVHAKNIVTRFHQARAKV